jgi:hypothetical protein
VSAEISDSTSAIDGWVFVTGNGTEPAGVNLTVNDVTATIRYLPSGDSAG